MTLETMIYLFHSAVNLSGLPPIDIHALPPVYQVSQATLLQHVCEVTPDDCPDSPSIAGVFIPSTYEILLINTFDFDNNETDASFLVHEFVHALQYKQNPDLDSTCETVLAAETQAYHVQNLYLRSKGQLYRAGAILRFMSCPKKEN